MRPASSDSRRALRKDVRVRAKLRDRGAPAGFAVDVTDMSVTGFRCETSFTLYPGHTVWLTMAGLRPLEAKVAWRSGYLYGFAFAQPLHPAVFDHIVRLVAAEQPSAIR